MNYKIKRDNAFSSNIVQDYLGSILDSGSHSDCELMACGRRIKAHKAVLCSFSPYFKKLLTEVNKEDEPVLIFADLKFEELQILISYLYKGNIKVSPNEKTFLCEAAKSFEIKGVLDSICETESTKNLTSKQNIETTATVYALQGSSGKSNLEYEDPKLKPTLTHKSSENESNTTLELITDHSSRKSLSSPSTKRSINDSESSNTCKKLCTE